MPSPTLVEIFPICHQIAQYNNVRTLKLRTVNASYVAGRCKLRVNVL